MCNMYKVREGKGSKDMGDRLLFCGEVDCGGSMEVGLCPL